MTHDELMRLVSEARARYMAMTVEQRAYHDHEQRRSFARGMCPSDRDYAEWCKVVDQVIPPWPKP